MMDKHSPEGFMRLGPHWMYEISWEQSARVFVSFPVKTGFKLPIITYALSRMNPITNYINMHRMVATL